MADSETAGWAATPARIDKPRSVQALPINRSNPLGVGVTLLRVKAREYRKSSFPVNFRPGGFVARRFTAETRRTRRREGFAVQGAERS